MKYFLVLLVPVLFTISTGCNEPVEITRDEVVKVVEKFDQGWLKKDTAIVDQVLAPEYIYFTQSGGVFNRKNILYTAYSKEYQLNEMERKNISIWIRGNVAIVNTTWKGKGIYRGDNFDDYQRCSLTIIKHKGKVEILSEHCTPLKQLNL